MSERLFGSSVNNPQQLFQFDIRPMLERQLGRSMTDADIREMVRSVRVNGVVHHPISDIEEVKDFPQTCGCESEKNMYVDEDGILYETCEDCWVIKYDRGTRFEQERETVFPQIETRQGVVHREFPHDTGQDGEYRAVPPEQRTEARIGHHEIRRATRETEALHRLKGTTNGPVYTLRGVDIPRHGDTRE